MAHSQTVDDTGSLAAGSVGDLTGLLRAQLARMSDHQLQRLLLWLDERGAPEGRSFAVHQGDPADPGSRELVELRLRGTGAPQRKEKLRLSGMVGRAIGGGQPASL